jgi:hypothetical protein
MGVSFGVSKNGSEPAKRPASRAGRPRVQRRRGRRHRAGPKPTAAGEGCAAAISGLVRCPRRRRPQRAASGLSLLRRPSGAHGNGDRSLRSLPPAAGIWKRFHMIHYGRSGTGALARRWLELTIGTDPRGHLDRFPTDFLIACPARISARAAARCRKRRSLPPVGRHTDGARRIRRFNEGGALKTWRQM